MLWDTRELVEFLVIAHHATYANPDGRKLKVPHRPGCEEYSYTSGDWCYLDSYAQGFSGGGQEIVYFQGKPVWLMNYYGFLINFESQRLIYEFLKEALRRRHPDFPVRGANLRDHLYNLRYEIDFDKKDIARFRGKEYIYQEETLAYECFFHGGIVT